VSDILLGIRDLVVEFSTDEGRVRALDGVSFDVREGGTLGIVGESGCGKSVTALSIMRLLPQPMGQIVSGSIVFDGIELGALALPAMEKIRGAQIGMVFQEPMTALNPVHTIGRQLAEALVVHGKAKRHEALRRAADMLARVGIPAPDVRLGEYPHQLSGGMRQRVVIAMALICEPRLLIADEPTTALDVTIQAQILELIRELQRDLGMAVILITHDLGVIAETCESMVVMYAGNVVEAGSTLAIFDRPTHPYTRGLLASIPRLEQPARQRLSTIEGMVPSLYELPAGCRFSNRCALVQPACELALPGWEAIHEQHGVRCLRWRECAQ